MPSALTRRVTRLEVSRPAQHPLLAVAKMPVAEWSDEALAEFLEAMDDGTPSAKALLSAMSPSNLEALMELVREEKKEF